MPYCVIDDLIKALPEQQLIRITDDDQTGAYDSGRVQEAIDSASEEVDVYLGGRIALPITGDIPPILSKMAVDIAIYNLYSRVKEQIPETRKERYRNATRFLEKVSEGKISLGLQPPPSPPADGGYSGGGLVNARDKIFSPDNLEKY